uniref:Uncharacterized protein n=1 Tax=viral metagenome TaxID=1070528 RepID=A0A6C0KVY0_9ZZZZ
MSSVRRVVAQRPSNLYYSDDGPYFYSYADILQQAAEYNGVQNGNQFTFPDEIACADAMYYLDYNADHTGRNLNGHRTYTDMGKEIKFGVKGGQNDHFTLRLVQLRGLDNVASTVGPSYNTFWVLVDSKTTTGMKDELGSYGQVYISRA